jgi:hypothetical protein
MLLAFILPASVFSISIFCIGLFLIGCKIGCKIGEIIDPLYGKLGLFEVTDPHDKTLDQEVQWNDGYYIEGLDRCANIQNIINEQLLYHPAIIRAGQEDKIDEAIKLIGNVYQTIGAMQFFEEKEDDKINKG